MLFRVACFDYVLVLIPWRTRWFCTDCFIFRLEIYKSSLKSFHITRCAKKCNFARQQTINFYHEIAWCTFEVLCVRVPQIGFQKLVSGAFEATIKDMHDMMFVIYTHMTILSFRSSTNHTQKNLPSENCSITHKVERGDWHISNISWPPRVQILHGAKS